MKKILLFMVVIFLAYSCQDFNNTASFPEYVQWNTASARIDENSATPVTVEVQIVGGLKTSSTEIMFDVEETNVVEGVDYTFPNGKTLVIGANESTATLTIGVIDNPNFVAEMRAITITIASAGNGLSVGDTTSVKNRVTIIIVEDDCPVPSLEGLFNVETLDTNPGGCSGVTHEIELVSSGENSYIVADITGGLYPNCYGAGDNPAEITVDLFAISLVDQPDVVYGGDIFNGSGVINCDGSFSITWSNSYGDSGTSYYSK